MDPKKCRFPGIEKQRQERGLTQDQVAAFADPTLRKDWYWRIQTWRTDCSWGYVLGMASGLGMNLDSVRLHNCTAPVVTETERIKDLRGLATMSQKKPAIRKPIERTRAQALRRNI